MGILEIGHRSKDKGLILEDGNRASWGIEE
jgi:hypothetical protein